MGLLSFRDDWYDSLTALEKRVYRKHVEAKRMLNQAQHLNAATIRLLHRVEQTMITRREVDHGDGTPDGRIPSIGEEEIARDEARRESYRALALEARFAHSIRETLNALGAAFRGDSK